LLFLVFRRMTGAVWPCAMVAIVFAIHPLRAESVAWVSERKDLLSGLFFFLTLWAYIDYVQHRFSWRRYLTVIVLFALGLMSKPMLVTLPCVLLLLDYWPLGRVASGQWPVASDRSRDSNSASGAVSCSSLATDHRPLTTLLLEKLPLFALTLVSCLLTRWAQTEAIVSTATIPLVDRVGNALVAYVAYLGQFFYPVGLAPLYPHPGSAISIAVVFFAALLLVGVSVAAWLARRRCPYWLVGWFWYLGMMVPVIGLVQVGIQARADRYTYLPQIGLCVALTWAAVDLTRRIPQRRWILGAAAAVILLDLTAIGWLQASYWRDGETLWAHVVSDHPDNAVAHNNLGTLLAHRGQLDAASVCFQKALEISPNFPDAHNNLAGVMIRRGQIDEAIVHYKKAIQIKPDVAEPHNNLGNLYFGRGELDKAAASYQEALKINPDLAEAHSNLGRALSAQGKFDAAVAQFREALRIQPDYVAAGYNLGATLAQQGHFTEAVEAIRHAIASAERHGDAATANALRERLRLCQAEIERSQSPSRSKP
ncbi:MAG: tetratricopeptide repeat protein, partial [Thermoguttaceae bacterium]